MKVRPALSVFILFFLMFSLITPASAGAIDTSINVVANGIEKYFENKQQESFMRSYGVSFGNTSQAEKLTPAQKIVFMVGTAEHHPFETPWVRETFANDFVWYYYALLWVGIFTTALTLLHKVAPQTVGSFSNRFVGHEGAFDYTIWFETIGLLAILPVIAFPLIEGLIEVEQTISSGMMLNSLEFLNANAGAGTRGGVFFGEGFVYSSCASFFAYRIQFINQFCANIMKIIFLFAVAWMNSRGFAKVLIEWFCSALAMRPLVLWYSCMAVKDITTAVNYTELKGVSIWDDNGLYALKAVEVAGVISTDMSLVLVASFLTGFIAIGWPVFKFIVEVIMKYLIGALYKANQAAKLIDRVRGS